MSKKVEVSIPFNVIDMELDIVKSIARDFNIPAMLLTGHPYCRCSCMPDEFYIIEEITEDAEFEVVEPKLLTDGNEEQKDIG